MSERALRCRFGIHKWTVRREPDVTPFHQCLRCGKVRSGDIPASDLGGVS
jgi:hypothetical protein